MDVLDRVERVWERNGDLADTSSATAALHTSGDSGVVQSFSEVDQLQSRLDTTSVGTGNR
jgi:hypothetical protein